MKKTTMAGAALLLTMAGTLLGGTVAWAVPATPLPAGTQLSALTCDPATHGAALSIIDLEERTLRPVGPITTSDGAALTTCLAQGAYSPDATTIYTAMESGTTSKLVTVDVATRIATVGPTFSSNRQIWGLTVGTDGTLYAIANNNTGAADISTVDPATGTQTNIIAVGGGSYEYGWGLAFDADSGLLYNTAYGNVYSYDPDAGTQTLLPGQIFATGSAPYDSVQVAGGRIWTYNPSYGSGTALISTDLADLNGGQVSYGQLTRYDQPTITALLIGATSLVPAPVPAAPTGNGTTTTDTSAGPALAETGVDGSVFAIYGAGSMLALVAGIGCVLLERRRREV